MKKFKFTLLPDEFKEIQLALTDNVLDNEIRESGRTPYEMMKDTFFELCEKDECGNFVFGLPAFRILVNMLIDLNEAYREDIFTLARGLKAGDLYLDAFDDMQCLAKAWTIVLSNEEAYRYASTLQRQEVTSSD